MGALAPFGVGADRGDRFLRAAAAGDAAVPLAEKGAGPGRREGCASIGALIGLDLVATRPSQVRRLIAHEAAVASLLDEPERSQAEATQRDVEETYQRDGLLPALRKLFAIAGGFADDPEPETTPVMPAGEAAERHLANMRFFLTHDAPAAHRYQVDLAALARSAPAISPAAGELSPDSFPYRCAQSLARKLGRPLTTFPGSHSGYTRRPRAFAEALHHTLSGQRRP